MKEETQYKYQELVNQTIDYISSHLYESITVGILAEKMCVSPYHFHRIMRSHINESLATYITRQRVERAAQLLQTGKWKLNDLADKIGFETPQSLSKAFKKHFGLSPAAFGKVAASEFKVMRKKNTFKKINLLPDIVEQEELNLVYIRIFGKYGDTELYPKTWKKLGDYLKVKNMQVKNTRWVGISFDDPDITLHEKCRFYACATVEEQVEPQGNFGSLSIKKGKYAVYEESENIESLQNLYDNIYRDFPFTLRDSVSFEEYIYDKAKERIITKIFIPIQ